VFRNWVELFLARRSSRRTWTHKEALLGRDRRVFYRVPMQSPCRLSNRLFGLEGRGVTLNLGLCGAGFAAPIQWPEASRIRFQMESPEFSAEAMIVFRVDATPECRYGIKFQDMGFRQLVRLRRILREKYDGPLAAL